MQNSMLPRLAGHSRHDCFWALQYNHTRILCRSRHGGLVETKSFADLEAGPGTSKDADMAMSEACDSDLPLAVLAKRKTDAGADGANSPVAPRISAKRPKTAHKDIDTESHSPEAEPEAAEPSSAEGAVSLPKTKADAALPKKKVLLRVSRYQCIVCLQVQD